MARKRARKTPIRIGLTINPAESVPAVLWNNGIAQNVVHLGLLLQAMDDVEPFLVVYPFDKQAIHPVGASFKIPTINTEEAALQLDIVLEIGVRLEAEFTDPYRKLGGKLVSYMAGNSMVMSMESVFLPVAVGGELSIEQVDGKPVAKLVNMKPGGAERGAILAKDHFDAVWITPQHWHMNAGFIRSAVGPAFKAPHIWSPAAIEHSKQALGVDPTWKGRPEKGWSLGTFDPNINVVKTFHLPLLVAHEAYKHIPDDIRRMMLFSANHLNGRLHFERFVTSMSIPVGKITSEPRQPICLMLGREVDAVITHQWENSLNYLFWDTLHLGYPLIHNSPDILEAGYYYESFNPADGGRALMQAISEHSGPSEADKHAVWRHHIENPVNSGIYHDLIEKLLDEDKKGD